MMRRLTGALFLLFFSLIGIGIIFSDAHLLNLCRRGCEANTLIYVLFGNETGKAVVGGLTIALGVWIFWFTWRRKTVIKNYYSD